MDAISNLSDPLIVALQVVRECRGRKRHPKTVRELAVKNMAIQQRAKLKQQLKVETDTLKTLAMCRQLRYLPHYLTYLQTMMLDWAQKTILRYQTYGINSS